MRPNGIHLSANTHLNQSNRLNTYQSTKADFIHMIFQTPQVSVVYLSCNLTTQYFLLQYQCFHQIRMREQAKQAVQRLGCTSLIARCMGPTWGPSGAGRTQVGPMLAPWTLLSGMYRWFDRGGLVHVKLSVQLHRISPLKLGAIKFCGQKLVEIILMPISYHLS